LPPQTPKGLFFFGKVAVTWLFGGGKFPKKTLWGRFLIRGGALGGRGGEGYCNGKKGGKKNNFLANKKRAKGLKKKPNF